MNKEDEEALEILTEEILNIIFESVRKIILLIHNKWVKKTNEKKD